MNNNPLLGQVLGGLFGQAMARRGGIGGGGGLGGSAGGLGGGLGGAALGSILGGMLGGARRGSTGVPAGRGGALGGGRGTLVMMLLPFVMRWVQQNGGIGAVLKRFQQKGYERQTQSWMTVGQQNEALDEHAVEQVIGRDQISQLAQRFGVPEQEVAQAVAEIMPEMVDQLTPQGQLPAHADDVLQEGASELEREIEKATGTTIG